MRGLKATTLALALVRTSALADEERNADRLRLWPSIQFGIGWRF